MSNFCDHCQGQRFDRARVLHALRQLRKDLRMADRNRKADAALAQALAIVRTLEIPHPDVEVEEEGHLIH